MLTDFGEGILLFWVGLVVGCVVGVGFSSILHRTFGRFFAFFATPRERKLRREGAEWRLLSRTMESRMRKKDALIRQAILTAQREDRARVARMVGAGADGAVDAVLRFFRRPTRPVPEEALQRCRETYPHTARYLEKALRT